MKLLIVESPSKAKTINSYLGKDFKVISSFGHVRGLPSQEGSVNPDADFQMRYEVLDKAHKHVSEIIKNAKNADEIYLATDPDREGEAISWHIVELLKDKKAIPKTTTVKRVVFNEITKNAIQQAVNNPRDLDLNLVQAQQTRQALDYLVGFTLSPVLWRKLPGSRSAGRVQSVALKVICERESEIEKFISREYWSIEGFFNSLAQANFKGMLTHFDFKKLDKFDINNEKSAKDILSQITKQNYSISKVEKKQVRRFPPPPFTTSTMLQEASRKLGFSAKRTSQIAQSLYEGVDIGGNTTGLITYMRTDSVNVSTDAVNNTRKYIGAKFGNNFVPKSAKVYKTKSKNAQEAHEAIRPTDISLEPEKISKFLNNDQKRLYELIWKRMVSSQMENALLDLVSVDISSSDSSIVFRANGSTVVFDGYYILYKEGKDDIESEDSQTLPILKEGEDVELKSAEPNQHFTQPPPRYTEASLVKKMEEIGIGRPSTYPTIISILQEREYVKLDKKRFVPEPKGRIVIAFLSEYFSKYVEYDFTAKLENELDDIAGNDDNWLDVLKKFWKPFKTRTDEVTEFKNSDIITEIEKNLDSYLFSEEEGKKCPSCKGGHLGLKTGKFGSFVGCSNYPECKYVKQLSLSGEEQVDTGSQDFPKTLGLNNDGIEVTLRKGPYGLYVQIGEGKGAKRAGIPMGIVLSKINLEYALGMLALPRFVGNHPETGEPIKAGIGRFGPYLLYQGSFRSIKDHDPLHIDLGTAVDILAMPAPKSNRKKKVIKKKK